MKARIFATTLLAIASAAMAQAQMIYAATERHGQVGTISRHTTLLDAMNETNPIFTGPVPQRDGSIYVTKNAPLINQDSAYNMTNWYSDGGANTGQGNPNNTNFGFMQKADINGSTVLAVSALYTADLNTFNLQLSGENADYPNDFARLWNAGNPPGSGETTVGEWLSYNYTLSATGLNAVSNGDGTYSNTTNASSYSGSFYGLFRNLSQTDPGSNGYYVLRLTYNDISWAASNNFTLDDEFRAEAVPEPTTVAALSLGIVAMLRRRRARH